MLYSYVVASFVLAGVSATPPQHNLADLQPIQADTPNSTHYYIGPNGKLASSIGKSSPTAQPSKREDPPDEGGEWGPVVTIGIGRLGDIFDGLLDIFDDDKTTFLTKTITTSSEEPETTTETVTATVTTSSKSEEPITTTTTLDQETTTVFGEPTTTTISSPIPNPPTDTVTTTASPEPSPPTETVTTTASPEPTPPTETVTMPVPMPGQPGCYIVDEDGHIDVSKC